MSSDGSVVQERVDGVVRITFEHPKSNSLPGHVLRGIAAAVDEAGSDEATRVIVLQSEGAKAFCAGASFDELLAIDTKEKGKEFFSGFALVINAIRRSRCIVIGRVQAKAVGGGVGLAAACDVCYAHESASARLSELAIGIGPFVVGPAVCRKIGDQAFTTMSTTPATWRSAAWCEEKGLYTAVYDLHAELDTTVNAHAAELAGYSAEAMEALKRVLWKGTEDWDTLLEERAELSGKLVLSEATTKAIAAFKATK